MVGGLACHAELSDNDDPQGRSQRAVLPADSNLPPLESRYFPDRLHAFVWRNWNAVEPAKLAKILNTSVENVRALAESMGLPPDAAVGPEMRARGYITLLRRNWHLLPYDQLMELVEMTPERLAVVFSDESDLGPKPKCEPLHYRAPDEAARRRAAEIRRTVEEVFGDEIRRPAEPRFAFVQQLSNPLPSLSRPKPADDRDAALRFIYSYLRSTAMRWRIPSWILIPTGCCSGFPPWQSTAYGCASCCMTSRRVERRFPSSASVTANGWPISGPSWRGQKNTASTCIST